jgi:hypothetical protein
MRKDYSASLLMVAALATPSMRCVSTPATPTSSEPAEASGPGVDASALPSGSDAATPVNDVPSASDDASSSSDDGSSLSQATSDAGPEEAMTGDAGDAAVWAAWPMPNSPTGGLPHPQSYDTSVAGIALDQVTGLTWQRQATTLTSAQESDATTILEQAAATCAQLSLADYSDWRVPSRIELVSIMDFDTDPAQDVSVFGDADVYYLSSSVHTVNGANSTVAAIWVGDGTTDSAGGSVTYMSIAPLVLQDAGQIQGPVAVRCVRGHGSATGPHYTVSGGEVHDNWTGLTWIQSLSASTMLPSTVSSYCASQTLDGGGWRAPSVNELETLWGDYWSPDAVMVDPNVFQAISVQTIGTSQTYQSDNASGPVEWLYVVNALTGAQQDEDYVNPLPGGSPAMAYWVDAQCVK